jgi:hypothetical protein
VKLRRRTEKSPGRFSFRTVAGEGCVLPSVSRRVPCRSQIDLWTSDNAAYAVEGLEVVRDALRRLSDGGSPSASAKAAGLVHGLSREEAVSLRRFLTEIMTIEETDQGRWHLC